MGVAHLLLAFVAAPAAVWAAQQDDEFFLAVNPIRRVVTMLQTMQKRVEAEGAKEKQLHDNFQCYCKGNGGTLSESISGAETKIPQVGSDIEEAESMKVQLDLDLKQHRADRDAAKGAIAEATSIREKEASEFAKESGEYNSNLAAVDAAIAAVSKGMTGGFLQTATAQVLRRLVTGRQDMLDADRQDLLAFLSSSQDTAYAPQSGQVLGIMKQLRDEMAAGLAEEVGAEKASVKMYEELMNAKRQEIAALTKSIEEKTTRVGELAVDIVQMKNDLGNTQEGLTADRKFLADLANNCALKAKEWEERSATRAQELVALADTIKVLNDDAALELFKKTLPSAGASLVQTKSSIAAVRAHALAAIKSARTSSSNRGRIDFIALAIHGKKIGFEKVVAMIDGMVDTLKKEQADDDHKKEYCSEQFDFSDDKKKGLERSVSDLAAAIDKLENGIASLADEVGALKSGIKALDKSVAEATEQRKAEHEEFAELMASDSAAKELLNFAKNRLNKFYNSALYKAPAKRALTEEQRISLNFGGTLAPTAPPAGIAGTGVTVLAQVSAHVERKDAPPPPPETYAAYAKRAEDSNGVIAMMNLLIEDLDKEMTEAETDEKDAQADYKVAMSDAAEMRASDSKALAGKESATADMTADLESSKEAKSSAGSELKATLEYINSLHAECDWLLQYFQMRKDARASEVDALGNAKAVLRGADFSLLQRSAGKFLERA